MLTQRDDSTSTFKCHRLGAGLECGRLPSVCVQRRSMCSGRSTVLHAHDWQELRLQLEKQASGSQPHPQTPSPAGPAPAKDEAATVRFFAEHWARLEMPPRPLCLASRPVAPKSLRVRDFGRRAGPALAGMSVAMPGGRGSPGLGHANHARAGPGIDGGPGPASRRGAVATPWAAGRAASWCAHWPAGQPLAAAAIQNPPSAPMELPQDPRLSGMCTGRVCTRSVTLPGS